MKNKHDLTVLACLPYNFCPSKTWTMRPTQYCLCRIFQCDTTSVCNKTQKYSQSCSSLSHHDCGDHNSNTTLASMESCRSCEQSDRRHDSRSPSNPRSTCDPRSPSSVPRSTGKSLHMGSRSSDNGYSSCGDGCESCSMPSSNDGSDIACSDSVCTGACNGLDGKYMVGLGFEV